MTIYEALDHPWLNVSTTVYYYVVSTSTIQLLIQSPQNHRADVTNPAWYLLY